jgi:hypothetical protein
MMGRAYRNTFAAALAVTAAAVLLPGAASADTVKIGSTLGHAANTNGELCAPCVGVQRTQQGGTSPQSLTSPVNGVVTQWAVRTSDPNASYTFRILRPVSGTTYTSVGASSDLTVPPTTTDSTLINAISLPINQGDAIGIAVNNAGHGLPSWPDNVQTDVVGYVAPPFADGTTSTPFIDIPGHELLVQASVKFCKVPNLHRLKKVLAKTALTNADCGVKVKKKDTGKRKFRGKVLKQKKPVGSTFPPGTVVPIVIGTK